MMKKTLLIAVFLFCASVTTSAAQEKVILGGAGTMGKAVEVLVQAFKGNHASDAIEAIPDAMSTTGGIEGTKSGRLTIGIVARQLSQDEKKEGLVYRAITRFPVVVAMHKSLPVTSLSDAQICDIFSGKIKSWKEVGGGDAKMVVVGRTKDDNNIEVFRERMTCFRTLQLTSDAVLLVRGNEVLDSLNNRPGTVSIVDAGGSMMERPTIKAVMVGGVSPGVDGLKSGKYKYYNEVGFVTLGEAKGTAKRFIDFVTSGAGEKILEKFNMAGAR